MKKILVINGPNLNMLGIREPEIYGHRTYADLVDYITESVRALGAETTVIQSNYEGEIVTAIQSAYGKYDGIIINPAAYSHTSIAILDEFRRVSYVREACVKTVSGLGFDGYAEAARFLTENY